MLFILH